MSFVTGYQAGMQTTDGAALPHDFKICAAVEPYNQLMLGVRVGRTVHRKIKNTRVNHAN